MDINPAAALEWLLRGFFFGVGVLGGASCLLSLSKLCTKVIKKIAPSTR